MSREAELVLQVWDVMRDHLPHAKRLELAKDMLYAFAEWFDRSDLGTIVDEDPDLSEAFIEVFATDDEDHHSEDE